MKWLADENISSSAIDLLCQRGQEVLTVASLAPGARDEELIQLVVAHGCILVSFDRDHDDLIFGQSVAPSSAVVYLRLYPPSPDALRKVLASVIELGDAVLKGQFTVVTREGVRQRALPSSK